MKSINLIKKKKEVPSFSNARGFTLIEIMVVVIIIGTIAGLVGVKIIDKLQEAKEEAAFTQMQQLVSALKFFHIKNGMYPQNLQMLVMDPTGGGGYLDSDVVPLDPWHNEYLFISDGQNFRIWSMGGDGRDQGGEGDDIIGK